MVRKLRDGTWVRVVTIIAPNGASYLWFEPLHPLAPVRAESDLGTFAALFGSAS